MRGAQYRCCPINGESSRSTPCASLALGHRSPRYEYNTRTHSCRAQPHSAFRRRLSRWLVRFPVEVRYVVASGCSFCDPRGFMVPTILTGESAQHMLRRRAVVAAHRRTMSFNAADGEPALGFRPAKWAVVLAPPFQRRGRRGRREPQKFLPMIRAPLFASLCVPLR